MRFLFILLLITPVFAQERCLELGITFPADRDTIESSRIRLAAWVSDSAATVSVNNKNLRVYPSGAFVSLLDLQPGWNQFVLTARMDSTVATDTLRIYRIPPLQPVPEIPTAFAGSFLLPANPLYYYAPDQIVVQFMGSPGGTASFEIDDLTDDPLPMAELNPDESNGIRGLYRGVYQIKPGDQCENERPVFYLKGKDNKKKKWKTDCSITVNQPGQPYLVETSDETNLVYYQPESEIFLELPKGIRLELIADLGRWLKVKISTTRSGFIRANSVNKSGYGFQIPQSRCSGFTSRFVNDWLTFNFNLSQMVPFQIRQKSNPSAVELTLFNTYMQDEWSVLPENDALLNPDSSFLKNFDWQQTGDGGLQFTFYLNTEQQWGFRAWYEDKRFRVAIRRPPQITPDNPLKNLIIALDAGHGGEHRGAVGATGYMEKTANLIYTNFLAQMLRDAGARVILTRTVDTTMNLKPRADIARQNNAHLLVWLHNNSVGDSRDPLAAKGTSTYYTHPQGQLFAQYVYPELLKLDLGPVGRIHRTYYITRQSDMIVFLVEGAFLSHPEDEMFLMQETNLKNLAQAVFDGIKKYLTILAR
jgi:N-acetylmuramoyl-L-alanine amidase